MFGILGIFTLLMVLVALLANAYLPTAERLPMQWSLRGQINWTAPRYIGLGFFPALGFASMVAYILLMKYAGPREGQEDLVIPVMLLFGAIFLIIQIVHACLANRSLRNK